LPEQPDTTDRAAPQVIAIDGPAGAGKSTIARRLAAALGWAYLDTGAMYRALTLLALETGTALEDEEALLALMDEAGIHLDGAGRIHAHGEDLGDRIRTAAVTAAVSQVASLPLVRDRIVTLQRAFAAQNGRIVAEGRDMGTVVFPEARLKIWLDARAQERARRRLAEGSEQTGGEDLAEMQARISRRDQQDSSRSVSPLRKADDAWALDTTGMTLDEVYAAVVSRVKSRVRP
jgi:cytidylate kinase